MGERGFGVPPEEGDLEGVRVPRAIVVAVTLMFAVLGVLALLGLLALGGGCP